MHKDLLLKAKQWLIGTNRCNPVFIERGSQRLCEFPDAIGWDAKECIVVECKASLEDFRADKKKACRLTGGLGSQRYFMIPQALRSVVEKEMPQGWGLLVVNERICRHCRRASVASRAKRIRLMQSEQRFAA